MTTESQRWSRRRFLGATLAATGAAVAGPAILAGCSLQDASARDPSDTDPHARFAGSLVSPGMVKPDVTFTDMDGKPFPLREKTRGRLTILAFGYTNCPDVCPVYLNGLARSIETIGDWPNGDPMVLFVGVDVARDTPAQLRKYLGRINPTFLGLTGTEKLIAEANRKLYMPPIIIESPGKDGSYAVDHGTQVFAFTADNVAHRIYNSKTVRQGQWVKDLPRLAEGQYK